MVALPVYVIVTDSIGIFMEDIYKKIHFFLALFTGSRRHCTLKYVVVGFDSGHQCVSSVIIVRWWYSNLGH